MKNHPHPINAVEIERLLGSPQPEALPIILEIGCNDGADTTELLTVDGVSLYCFEPEPRALTRFHDKVLHIKDAEAAAKYLVEHYVKWPDMEDWSVIPYTMPNGRRLYLLPLALGKEVGKATFHQSGGTTQGAHLQDWDLSGSLKKPVGHKDRHKWCTFDRQITVPVTTLDACGFPYVDFMWIDVQGAEGDVFAGGKQTLKKTHFVYAEFNDWKKPLYEGDLNLDQTLAALGPAWEPLCLYEGYNVLCRNKEFTRA